MDDSNNPTFKELPVGNTYGSLCIKIEDGRYYWCVQDCFGDDWSEISEVLYRILLNYAK